MNAERHASVPSTTSTAVRHPAACDLERPAALGVHLLVVIGHRMARIYRARLKGSVSKRVTPGDPGGFGRHSHFVQDDSSGQSRAEHKGFYDAVANTLHEAHTILVLGSGAAASSAMRQLLVEFGLYHRGIAKRIVGAIVVDQDLTENQLLARARGFYAKPF